jgi:hypothetical protein
MKSFLFNAGHLLLLIVCSGGTMFAIQHFFEPHQSLGENLSFSAPMGAFIGAMAYYRTKPRW